MAIASIYPHKTFTANHPILIRFMKEANLFNMWRKYIRFRPPSSKCDTIDRVLGSASFTDYITGKVKNPPPILRSCNITVVFRWWLIFYESDWLIKNKGLGRPLSLDFNWDDMIEFLSNTGTNEIKRNINFKTIGLEYTKKYERYAKRAKLATPFI